MIVSDRNKLYNLAYALDNLPRSRVSCPSNGGGKLIEVKPLTERLLMKRRIQEKTSDLYVLLTSDELEQISELIRSLVSADEERHAG